MAQPFPGRRGLPIAVAMAVAVPAVYVGRVDQWLGVWSETQAIVGVALILGLPTAAAAGAWSGYVGRSSGLDMLAAGSSRPTVFVVGREQAALCAWVLLGFFVGLAPAYAATALSPHSGAPSVLPLSAQSAWVCSATVVAAWVGRATMSYIAAPACAVAVYFTLGFLQYAEVDTLTAVVPLDARAMSFYRLRWWVPIDQAVAWGLLVGAVVAYRARLRRATWTALWAAGLAATPLVLVGPSDRVADHAASAIACSDLSTTAVVCLPAAKAYLQQELVQVLDRAERLLSGLRVGGLAYVDDEARGTSRTATQSIASTARKQQAAGREILFSHSADIPQTQLHSDEFLLYFAGATFPDRGRRVAGYGHPMATPSEALTRWFLERMGVPTDGSAAPGAAPLDGRFVSFRGRHRQLAAFDRLTADQRETWFAEHRAEIRGGRLQWSAFDDFAS
jgi:hypothetical protein